ncbi:MAG: sialidase family protein [Gemmatimonadota bacterium]
MKVAKLILTVILVTACGDTAPKIEPASGPVSVARNEADPALARDPSTGDVLMTWVAGDSTDYHVYFARSSDAGASWSSPVRVTQTAGDVKPHGEASPRVVAGGTIAVIWANQIAVAGRRFPASEMRFSRSTDGGRSWSPALTLNDDTAAAPAGHTFHGAVFVPPSTIAVAWLDSRNAESSDHHDGDATIYMALSDDLGGSWSEQNRKLWADACPCCRVSLAARPDRQILAAWRGHMPGDIRDPVVARVVGEPAPPVRVHADDWVFGGCPHTGPALNVTTDDVVQVAWFSGKPGRSGIFYAESRGDTISFSAPVEIMTAAALPAAHPAIASNDEYVFVAHDLDAAGRSALSVARIANGRAISVTVPDSRGADHPQIVALDQGALVAWTQKTADSSVVRLARIR